jgi:hypothetical protein
MEMIYWYYMYYHLNLAQKIIMIIAICSFIVAIIVTIKGIILINQCNKTNKYYRNITTFSYGKAKNRNQKKGE